MPPVQLAASFQLLDVALKPVQLSVSPARAGRAARTLMAARDGRRRSFLLMVRFFINGGGDVAFEEDGSLLIMVDDLHFSAIQINVFLRQKIEFFRQFSIPSRRTGPAHWGTKVVTDRPGRLCSCVSCPKFATERRQAPVGYSFDNMPFWRT